MAKTHHSKIHPVRQGGDDHPKPGRPHSERREEDVARLAYALWERRGADSRGTAEQDWQDAEAAIALDEELRRAARAS